MVKLQLELLLDFRANSEACVFPVWSGPVRPPAAAAGTDQIDFCHRTKKDLRPTASGTGLVLGERFRALIGFVWPARNGTASDTVAAGSDGTGSVPVPVPELSRYPPPPRLPPFYPVSSSCPVSLTICLPFTGFLVGFPGQFRSLRISGLVRSGPPSCGRGRHRPDRFLPSDQKGFTSDCIWYRTSAG